MKILRTDDFTLIVDDVFTPNCQLKEWMGTGPSCTRRTVTSMTCSNLDGVLLPFRFCKFDGRYVLSYHRRFHKEEQRYIDKMRVREDFSKVFCQELSSESMITKGGGG